MPTNAFHVSLNVANLEYAVGFYRLLFGCDPAKWYPDYAKFELESPALVLSLEPSPHAAGGALNHLGLRVGSRAEVDTVEAKLRGVGVSVQRLDDIECCYSRQSKIVFRDPDGNLVEIYVVEGDADRKEAPRAAETATVAALRPDASWEHLVGSAFPDVIPAPAASLDEVRLRGTFNCPDELGAAAHVLAVAGEALRPGGRLLVHLLVADRQLLGDLPPLPPPADQVRCVPTEAEIVELIEGAGFTHLELKRLSHAPVMQLGDVELRELLLHASKPSTDGKGTVKQIIYKGPFAKVEDDGGRVFARGRRVPVGQSELAWLEERGWLDGFFVLEAGNGNACEATQ